MRIAIIGTGPTAVAVHSTLMKNNFPCSIVVIDRSIQAKPINTEMNLPKTLKTFRGSNMMYRNVLEPGEGMDAKSYLLGSQGFGGFSTVWGAVTDPSLKEFGAALLKNQNQYIEELLFPKCNIASTDSEYRIVRNELFLAVDETLCTKCGECLLGCKFGAIWSAKKYWEKISDLKLESGDGVSYIESQNSDQITLFDSKRNKIGTYDQVFLAAGTLASLKILIQSKIISNTKLLQSDLEIVPWFSRKPLELNSLNLSLASSTFDVQKNGKKVGYVQMYANLEKAKEVISKNVPLIKYLPDRVWRRISRHLGVAFIYYDSKISREIEFYVESKRTETRIMDSGEKIKGRREVSRNTLRFLRSRRIIPLSVFRRDEPVGRSFHVGSLGKLGDVEDMKIVFYGNKLVCVDGLALSGVDAGHITSRIMENAQKITKTIIEMRS